MHCRACIFLQCSPQLYITATDTAHTVKQTCAGHALIQPLPVYCLRHLQVFVRVFYDHAQPLKECFSCLRRPAFPAVSPGLVRQDHIVFLSTVT